MRSENVGYILLTQMPMILIGSHALFCGQNETADSPEPCPNSATNEAENPVDHFLQDKTITAAKVKCTFVPPTKRKTLSSVIAGKSVTEESVVKDISQHLSQQKQTKNSNMIDLSTHKMKSPNA